MPDKALIKEIFLSGIRTVWTNKGKGLTGDELFELWWKENSVNFRVRKASNERDSPKFRKQFRKWD